MEYRWLFNTADATVRVDFKQFRVIMNDKGRVLEKRQLWLN